MRTTRRGVLSLTGAIAFLTLLATTAFACIVWKGKLTVENVTEDSSRAGQEVEVVGDPGADGHLFMQWCDSTEPVPAVDAAQGDTLRVTVSPARECDYDDTPRSADNKVPPGLYIVTLFDGQTFTNDDGSTNEDGEATYDDGEWGPHCMLQGSNSGHVLGSFVIGTDGTASGDFTVPSDAQPVEGASLCVSQAWPPFVGGLSTQDPVDPPAGNMMPVDVIL